VEVIPFDQFMKGSSTLTPDLSTISIGQFIDTERIIESYWLLGGIGAVLTLLYFLESQGYVNVNDKLVKLGMMGVWGYVVFRLVTEDLLPLVF